ncbi:MAG: RNA 2',3'-cyclic phosphodiesterase [Candidatus Helarchaeota archaeon]
MGTIRTFLCIDLIDNKIINDILEIQREFKTLKSRIKSTEQENIHITLKFLGNITIQDCNTIVKLLNDIKFSPFELNIKGLGVFPNIFRPRIIWVGLGNGADNVKDIYNQINNKLKGFQFKKESFKSHITISRVKFFDRADSNRIKKLFDAYKDKDFGIINISSFQFKKSTLTPKGPIYTTIKDFKSK